MLVVIGIGGSYLGARAAIEIADPFVLQLLPKERRGGPQIVFAGNNISSTYMAHLLEFLEGKDCLDQCHFQIRHDDGTGHRFPDLQAMDGEEIRQGRGRKAHLRHDRQGKGALKKLADEEGYETFVIPDDVGGRYSVLTAVGLLPIAAAGIDIRT